MLHSPDQLRHNLTMFRRSSLAETEAGPRGTGRRAPIARSWSRSQQSPALLLLAKVVPDRPHIGVKELLWLQFIFAFRQRASERIKLQVPFINGEIEESA